MMHLVNHCSTEVCPNSYILRDKSDHNQTTLAKGQARNMCGGFIFLLVEGAVARGPNTSMSEIHSDWQAVMNFFPNEDEDFYWQFTFQMLDQTSLGVPSTLASFGSL